jgi:hypothetical protein
MVMVLPLSSSPLSNWYIINLPYLCLDFKHAQVYGLIFSVFMLSIEALAFNS